MTELVIRLLIQIFFLAGVAFFSSAEAALFSLSRLDLQKLRRANHPQSDNLHELLAHPHRLVLSTLIGEEIFRIAATINLIGILFMFYENTTSVGWLNFIIMFFLLFLLGEILPKAMTHHNPVGYSVTVVSAMLLAWMRLITPLRLFLQYVADKTTTLVIGSARHQQNILRDDAFRTLITEVEEVGTLDSTERMIIENLVQAGETSVTKLMVPKANTAFLSVDTPISQAIDSFRKLQHSRLPVYQDHKDNLIGMLHSEDVMRLIQDKTDLAQTPLEEVIRSPIIIPPTKHIDEMFELFSTTQTRTAIIIDEWGNVEGLITLKDIVRFIFGDLLQAEMVDKSRYEVKFNVFEVPGSMPLHQFRNMTHLQVQNQAATIGGAVFYELGRLPTIGDRVHFGFWSARVLEMDRYQIAKLRIRLKGCS